MKKTPARGDVRHIKNGRELALQAVLDAPADSTVVVVILDGKGCGMNYVENGTAQNLALISCILSQDAAAGSFDE